MIARIARILLALQLLVAAGIAWALMETGRIGHPALAMLSGLGVVLLLRLLITANNFFLSRRFRSDTPPRYRLNRRQACRLFIGEFGATLTASSLTMPFCGFTMRMARNATGLPVLLVHGYVCNSGYWHAMSRTLLEAGISHHAIDMEPVIGGIDEYAPAIHRAIEALCEKTKSDKVVIVAHSMGGLAARAYLRQYGARRIAKVITLGTPHHGTAIAQLGIGLNTRQMHWTPGEQEGLSSEWLRDLAAGESAEIRALFVSLFSHHDNIIAPQTSSRLTGAVNIEFGGIGHVALASHAAIQQCVIAEIRKASPQATAAASRAARR